jgi:hypothetical protein
MNQTQNGNVTCCNVKGNKRIINANGFVSIPHQFTGIIIGANQTGTWRIEYVAPIVFVSA